MSDSAKRFLSWTSLPDAITVRPWSLRNFTKFVLSSGVLSYKILKFSTIF